MLDIRLEETRVYQEAKAEGEQLGRQAEASELVLRLLTRRLQQELPENIQSRIISLPLSLLEELSEALLDFEQLGDLQAWLQAHQVDELENQG